MKGYIINRNIFRHIDGEGTFSVNIKKRKNVRRINVHLDRPDKLDITIPYWVTYDEADKAVFSNTGWLKKYINRVKKAEQIHDSLLKNDHGLPREAAVAKITSKVYELSGKFGFRHNGVFVREQKTRWGSCSSTDKIYLNIKITRLPEELFEYIILHELMHTKIKNHGKQFWAELEKIIPGVKKVDKRVRGYQLRLL